MAISSTLLLLECDPLSQRTEEEGAADHPDHLLPWTHPTALGGALLFLDARGKNILDFWRRRKLLGVSSPQASEQGREMRRVFRLRGGCHSSFLWSPSPLSAWGDDRWNGPLYLLGALPARPRAVGYLVQRWIEAAQMEGLRTVVTAQQWPSILTGRAKVLVDHRIMRSSSQHGF